MAGSLSDYAENRIAELLVGKTAFATPTIYIGLFTSAPAESSSGEALPEVANSNNYARVATDGSDWESAAGGHTQNANAITFPQASGSWGTVTHFGAFTSGNYGEGNMLFWGDLTLEKAIDSGDTPSFAAGALDVTVS